MSVAQLKVRMCMTVYGRLLIPVQDFLKAKSQPVSGKKAELVDRVAEWFMKHGGT
jgi:hypothetical protein